MEISSLSSDASAAGLSAATSSQDASVISSDFETFLVMLTAQLQNQDPLNPMDSSDYAVQLATFSGVEQQVQTNDLLRALGAGNETSGLAGFAGWVGLEAQTNGSTYYGGDPLKLDVTVPSGAEWSQMVIRTQSGAEVNAIDVQPGASTVMWDGTWASGAAATLGTYVAELHHYTEGDAAPAVAAMATYTRIVEVRQNDAGLEAVLEGGAVMDVDDITALRSPT